MADINMNSVSGFYIKDKLSSGQQTVHQTARPAGAGLGNTTIMSICEISEQYVILNLNFL